MANAVLVESSPRVVTMRGEEMLQPSRVLKKSVERQKRA
jgi:hypothetical protein